MKKTNLLSLVLLMAATMLAGAETRLVPADYSAIQQAINDSNNGDVVIVSPGTYQENINFLGKSIVVTSTDPNNPEVVATTIIKAILKVRGDVSSIGSVVTFENGESPEAVLAGFTITKGYGTANYSIPDADYVFWGAGIYCSNSSPTITCNVITGNNGPLKIEGNDPEQWRLGYGGGIACVQSGAIITRNIIQDNSAYAGAGIMTYLGDAKICNNLIYNNSAFVGGGAVIFGGFLINNTIVSNNANLGGGGLVGNLYIACYADFGQTTILNNSICNAKSGGGVLMEGECSDSAFTFNNVWGNLPVNYPGIDNNTGQIISDDSADRTGQSGNISQNPCFRESYHIASYSPCFNAGDPNYVPYPWQRDIDGEYAVMGVQVDIGADEATDNARPVANAGPDQHFDTLVGNVVLDGTGSYDPDIMDVISYQWRQISGPNVTLVNPDAAQPNFAPVIGAVYIFELIVYDGSSKSAPDSVTIVVSNQTPQPRRR
ncbi:MAG: hypothetical protein A2173_06030 [Planctomycetes bacterium RBG_13_44_8b]|nr:MAG: hypothetical protein A2173_06030 [Planctomycetes bacterium RBG_13_44_8b]